jgi:hypothetical protein
VIRKERDHYRLEARSPKNTVADGIDVHSNFTQQFAAATALG